MSFRSKGSSSPRRPGFIPDIVSGTDSRWIPAFAGTRQLVLHQTNIEAKAMLRTRFKAHDAWLHPDIAIKALQIGHTGPRFNAKIICTGLLPKTQPRRVGKGNIQQWMTRRAPFQAATVEIIPDQRVMPEHRSEEHTSELQSLMRTSYADFCLKTTENPSTSGSSQKT